MGKKILQQSRTKMIDAFNGMINAILMRSNKLSEEEKVAVNHFKLMRTFHIEQRKLFGDLFFIRR